MDKFVKKDVSEIKSASEARQYAIDWQHWQSEQDLSYVDAMAWNAYFQGLAVRFNLVSEFRENGII